MKIALLSDLHLTSDPAVREFTHDPGRFLDLLDEIEAEHDAVFVAGDIFNLDLGKLPAGRGFEWRAARRVFDPIVRRLARPTYRRVHGNHDRALRRLDGTPEIHCETLAGRRIVMLHGHQFDGAVKQLPFIAPTGSWLSGWMHRLDAEPIAELLVDLGRFANAFDRKLLARIERRPRNETRPAERRDVTRAREVAARYGADLVLMGHTHTSIQARLGEAGGEGPLYVNAGACAFGDLQWTSIDLTDLSWRHQQLGRPVSFPGGGGHTGLGAHT